MNLTNGGGLEDSFGHHGVAAPPAQTTSVPTTNISLENCASAYAPPPQFQPTSYQPFYPQQVPSYTPPLQQPPQFIIPPPTPPKPPFRERLTPSLTITSISTGLAGVIVGIYSASYYLADWSSRNSAKSVLLQADVLGCYASAICLTIAAICGGLAWGLSKKRN